MNAGQPLSGKRYLILVDHDYEDLELWYPKLRLIEAGAQAVVAGPEADQVYRGKHGYPCRSDAAIRDMESADFHGLVLPGGFSPDKLRRDPKVKQLTAECARRPASWWPQFATAAGWRFRPASIAACVLPVRLASRTIWSMPAPFGRMRPVVVDRHFISSRKPDDLPDFSVRFSTFALHAAA